MLLLLLDGDEDELLPDFERLCFDLDIVEVLPEPLDIELPVPPVEPDDMLSPEPIEPVVLPPAPDEPIEPEEPIELPPEEPVEPEEPAVCAIAVVANRLAAAIIKIVFMIFSPEFGLVVQRLSCVVAASCWSKHRSWGCRSPRFPG